MAYLLRGSCPQVVGLVPQSKKCMSTGLPVIKADQRKYLHHNPRKNTIVPDGTIFPCWRPTNLKLL
jgi:hypothetical protein